MSFFEGALEKASTLRDYRTESRLTLYRAPYIRERLELAGIRPGERPYIGLALRVFLAEARLAV